jgi:hypothetical protein
MNLRGHKRLGIWLAEWLLASQEGPCSIESVNNVKTEIYNDITLYVVLYGCETWSQILTGEYRAFDNHLPSKEFWGNKMGQTDRQTGRMVETAQWEASLYAVSTSQFQGHYNKKGESGVGAERTA